MDVETNTGPENSSLVLRVSIRVQQPVAIIDIYCPHLTQMGASH